MKNPAGTTEPQRRRATAPGGLRRAATGALAVSLAAVVASCGTAADRPDHNSEAAPGIASAPMNTDTAMEGVATEQAPVYWVGTGDQSRYLFREFRTPTSQDTTDPVAQAALMVTSATPADPDYRSLWSAVDTVGTSVSPDGTITVDLPAAAFASQLSPQDARVALQQMVYTVSAAAVTAGLLDSSTAKEVRVLVNGQSGYKAFGAVELNAPLTRDPALAAPVWLVDPQTGAEPKSPVTVFARVLPSVRDALWEVLEDDRVVHSGNIAPASPGSDPTTGTELRTSVTLDPGTYTVRVSGTDDSDTTVSDDHTITVRAGD
ncbi:GerMN domain-containing protein [Kocuria sp. CPCC 205261]|uniref:GerMN domain-containing protein n=1 Tax=Kocuria sp. CPCC 205261 TaxID=3073554 RepID=UPI0034D54280